MKSITVVKLSLVSSGVGVPPVPFAADSLARIIEGSFVAAVRARYVLVRERVVLSILEILAT